MLCFSDGLKVAVQICQYVDADPWHVLWRLHIREYDPLLKSGKRLTDLSKLKRLADCFVTGREKGLNPNTLPNGLR
jgi:hypothetical protein